MERAADCCSEEVMPKHCDGNVGKGPRDEPEKEEGEAVVDGKGSGDETKREGVAGVDTSVPVVDWKKPVESVEGR